MKNPRKFICTCSYDYYNIRYGNILIETSKNIFICKAQKKFYKFKYLEPLIELEYLIPYTDIIIQPEVDPDQLETTGVFENISVSIEKIVRNQHKLMTILKRIELKLK